MSSTIKVIGNNIKWPARCVGCNSQSQLEQSITKFEVTGNYSSYGNYSYWSQMDIKWNYPICKSCQKYRVSSETFIGSCSGVFISLVFLFFPPAAEGAPLAVKVIFFIVLIVSSFLSVRILVNRMIYRKKIKYAGRKDFVQYKNVLVLGDHDVGFDEFKKLLANGGVVHVFEFGNIEYANEFERCNHVMT